jgi:hypothetical protein
LLQKSFFIVFTDKPPPKKGTVVRKAVAAFKRKPPTARRILQIIVTLYAISPFVLIPFFIYLDLDAPGILITIILKSLEIEKTFQIQAAILTWRICYIAISVTEGCRMMGFFIIYAFLRLISFVEYIKKLINFIADTCRKTNSSLRFRRIKLLIRFYNRCHINLRHDEEHVMNIVGAALFLLFSLSLVLNFVTIKMHHIFAPQFYIIFPAFSFVAFALLHISMPLMVEFGIGAGTVLQKFRLGVGLRIDKGLKRKLLEKRVQSLKELGIPVGFGNIKFFTVRKETKAAFYFMILDYTINLLLSLNV